jgi:hypothetical protein
MKSPPRESRPGGAANLEKQQLAHNAPDFYGTQAQWHREADRLLSEFERTGDMRHCAALSRHLAAMRERGVAP